MAQEFRTIKFQNHWLILKISNTNNSWQAQVIDRFDKREIALKKMWLYKHIAEISKKAFEKVSKEFNEQISN